jgi:hypothetical protein
VQQSKLPQIFVVATLFLPCYLSVVYLVAILFITTDYIWLQHCLLHQIIFGCNIIYGNDCIWLQQSLLPHIILDAILFIATTYFGLQYVLLPRTMRVAIEAITTPLVVATIEYTRGQI